jgi:hypothetical protein
MKRVLTYVGKKAADTVIVMVTGFVLAVLGVSSMLEGPPSNPLDFPAQVADGFEVLVDGMRVLVAAAGKYLQEP